MSIVAVEVVLAAPISPPALKLTALILANALHEPTGKLNPSLDFIAHRLVLSRRNAQRHVHALIDGGLLSVLSNAAGGAPGSTPNYLLNLPAIKALTGDADVPRKRIQINETGDASVTPTGDISVTRREKDGRHPCLRRVTSASGRGGTHVTQTVLNRIEPVCCDQLPLIATESPTLFRAPIGSSQSCPTRLLVKRIVTIYHELLPELPRVRVLEAKCRQRSIAEFWRWVMTSTRDDSTRRATTAAEGIDYVRRFFEQARKNDFVMGHTDRHAQHANWRATFDYLISERGRLQVIERTES